MLLDIALEMSKKQRALYEKDEKTRQQEEIAQYNKMFQEDKELPDSNPSLLREYMSLANEGYTTFCSPQLKELLSKTGLNYHPEFIKMFHKIGELLKEDGLDYGGKPSFDELTPAQILYGKRN